MKNSQHLSESASSKTNNICRVFYIPLLFHIWLLVTTRGWQIFNLGSILPVALITLAVPGLKIAKSKTVQVTA